MKSTRTERAFTPRVPLADERARTEQRRARRKVQVARQVARLRERRAQTKARGLTADGKRYTDYRVWKGVRTRALRQHETARVAVLDAEYPQYADTLRHESYPLTQAAQKETYRAYVREHMNLSNARKHQYKMEDIIEGDYVVASYAAFVGLFTSAHTTAAAKAALRQRYPAWHTRYRATKTTKRKQ